MKKNHRGFTLIELLVVISIIGLLASIVSASLMTARGKSRDARRRGDLNSARTALALYFDDNGRYPSGCNSDGQWSGESVFGNCTDHYITGLVPRYMQSLPRDPKGGSIGYIYIVVNNGQDYKLISYHSMESTVNRCPSSCNTTTYPWCATDYANTWWIATAPVACY